MSEREELTGTIAWVVQHYHHWLNRDGSVRADYIREGIVPDKCDCKPEIARYAPAFGEGSRMVWWPFGREMWLDNDPPIFYVELLRVIDVGEPR